ncbi:MAG: phytase [Spirosomataceae bacterium]
MRFFPLNQQGLLSFLLIATLTTSCLPKVPVSRVQPTLVTERVALDSDDTAIWIHPTQPSQSLILGTDKGNDEGMGGIYAFSLTGKIDTSKTIQNVQRPNNIDVGYGLPIGSDSTLDFAVFTERNVQKMRIIHVPSMQFLDGGGIDVFEGETERDPMGICVYQEPISHRIFVFVGRKNGPSDQYIWQYELSYSQQKKQITAQVVRKLGQFSGKKEIESLVADQENGYLYYSDETVGVRKYLAHPDSSTRELALFATRHVKRDHEGLSIYKTGATTGYILLSDQQANQFHVFPREGTATNKHAHPLLKRIKTATLESDGSDVTSIYLNEQFPRGLFVAMSTDGTFHFYNWTDIAGKELK